MGYTNANLAARAAKVLTGPQSNLAPPLPFPSIFAERASGHRIFDVEGRDYIDLALTMGPLIFGHGHPRWISAVEAQLDRLPSPLPGQFYSPLEVELGERMVSAIPCAERVKYGLSGSEVVQLVFRLARAFTNRPYILRFDGHYHGWMDNVLGGSINQDRHLPPHPIDSPGAAGGFNTSTAGRSPVALLDQYKIEWNDAEALQDVLEKYGDKIALIHMEPIMCNFGGCPPRPGYLEAVRELCDRYGIVLCFDEVITGFRVALGGAQEVFGVTPDLATYGKAIAAGLPFAAVAGRADIMELLSDRRVVGAGTFNCFPLGMAAAVATFDLLAEDNGAWFREVDRIQAHFRQSLSNMAISHGHDDLFLQGPRGQIYVDFLKADVAYSPAELNAADAARRGAFRLICMDEGLSIGAGSRIYISGTMSGEDITEALARFDKVFARLPKPN